MTSRSSTLSNIRRDSAATIFDLPAHYFENTATSIPRDTIPEIRQLLGYSVDEEGNVTYAKIAPVMCLNGDTSEVHNYFLHPCLFRVCYLVYTATRGLDILIISIMPQIARATLFGKTAAKNVDRAVSRAISQYLRTDIAAETTFGLISWVCMIVRIHFIYYLVESSLNSY